jgi:hypothetical protein
MDAKNYAKWQSIADEFLNSELDEAEFCNTKKLNIELFRRRLREVESHEVQQNSSNQEDNPFVELIPQGLYDPDADDGVQIKFRGADFILRSGFPAEVFRQALQIAKEVL